MDTQELVLLYCPNCGNTKMRAKANLGSKDVHTRCQVCLQKDLVPAIIDPSTSTFIGPK